MKTDLITISEYCVSYHINPSFIGALEDFGIIALTLVGQEKFIHTEQFAELEIYIHFHYDLHINMEGIDAIRHLLHKVNTMQKEIDTLKDKLHLHERSI